MKKPIMVPAALVADVLRGLRAGGCWCGVGIGHPALRGRHTPRCRDARELLERIEGEPT